MLLNYCIINYLLRIIHISQCESELIVIHWLQSAVNSKTVLRCWTVTDQNNTHGQSSISKKRDNIKNK